MINHARTLLINRSGGKQALTELGEEYIPETFTKQTLPNWLRLPWEALFGSAAGNTYKNYQVEKLLKLVHSTDYEPYLFEHDSRITYDPMLPGDFSDVDYDITYSSPTVLSVNRVGELTANEVLGVMSYKWKILIAGTGLKDITATNIQTGDTAVTPAGGLNITSQPIILPGIAMKVRTLVPRGALPDPVVLHLDALAKPTDDLTIKIANIEKLGESLRTLFGATADEPYLTFFGMWKQNMSFPDRVAGLVLALVFRLNDLFNKSANQ